jgi:hypothetical protein
MRYVELYDNEYVSAFRHHISGMMVLLLHDISDIILEITKLNTYLKKRNGREYKIHDIAATFSFLAFAGSWYVNDKHQTFSNLQVLLPFIFIPAQSDLYGFIWICEYVRSSYSVCAILQWNVNIAFNYEYLVVPRKINI